MPAMRPSPASIGIVLATIALLCFAGCSDEPEPGQCRTSADCPDEHNCFGFECRLACNTSAECLEPTDACEAGVCLPEALIGEACSAINPRGSCSAGATCFVGACQPESSLCSTANRTGLCAGDGSCIDGTCRAAAELCSSANQSGACAGSASCLEGACRAPADLCSTGNLTGWCATGASCLEGACRTPADLCSGSNQTGWCATGASCLEGACRTAADLCSTGNQTGWCASADTCIDGTCRTAAELCSSSNHTGACTGGATCLEGTCRAAAELCSMSNGDGVCLTGWECLAGRCHSEVVTLDFEDGTAGSGYDLTFAGGLRVVADWNYIATVAEGAGWGVDASKALRYPTKLESAAGSKHSQFRAGVGASDAWLTSAGVFDSGAVEFSLRIPEAGTVMNVEAGDTYYWTSAFWTWRSLDPDESLIVGFASETSLAIWKSDGPWLSDLAPLATVDITGHVEPGTLYRVRITYVRDAVAGSLDVDWDGVTFGITGDTTLTGSADISALCTANTVASDNDTTYFGAIDQVTFWRID